MVRWREMIGLALVTGGLVACGGQASSSSSPTASPSPSAPAASATPSPSPSATPTVITMSAGASGTIVVAGSNQMTVYTFSNDTPGVSNCSGGCLASWPALTIPAGQTPTAGQGVTGTLGRITRSDGSVQVTYNGLPLYFFHNDHAPGDLNGHYTGWNLVKP